MASEEWCPECESMTEQVLVTYRPDPNEAQREAEDIPTDNLPIAGATLCTECGYVPGILPKREVDNDE